MRSGDQFAYNQANNQMEKKEALKIPIRSARPKRPQHAFFGFGPPACPTNAMHFLPLIKKCEQTSRLWEKSLPPWMGKEGGRGVWAPHDKMHLPSRFHSPAGCVPTYLGSGFANNFLSCPEFSFSMNSNYKRRGGNPFLKIYLALW